MCIRDRISPELLVRDCRLYAAVLWRLLTAPALPFVIERAVEEMKQTVERLQDKLVGTFDFAPLQKRLDEIAGKAADFDALCRAAAEPGEEAEALVEPVSYTHLVRRRKKERERRGKKERVRPRKRERRRPWKRERAWPRKR